jgi:uncharacterized MAPEG superfamily protein
MPFAFWCILIAALLPLVWTGVAKAGTRYDNRTPRVSLEQGTGYHQRANWAQQNAWEAFGPFAAAVIVAYLMKVSAAKLDTAAMVFIIARVAHGLCYLANQATLRSLCWLVGLIMVIYLFIAAA